MHNETELQASLVDLLSTAEDLDTELGAPNVTTFEEEGLLTRNKGVVLKFRNGTEYQLTIVQKR